jgi:TRAP-type C4-dicarboxylate transport system permease small subunit
MKFFQKSISLLHTMVAILQAILLGILLCLVVYQVGARWLPFVPRALWTEEISRFLLVWVIFLGGAIGVRERSHFVLEVLTAHSSPIVNQIWEAFVISLEIAFCAIFCFRGFKYAAVLLYDISDVSQISMLWVGAAIPAFGGLSLLFLSELVLKKLVKGAK